MKCSTVFMSFMGSITAGWILHAEWERLFVFVGTFLVTMGVEKLCEKGSDRQ